MKCERVAELLPDYLEGNLSAEQEDQVESHLESCAQCHEEVATWRALANLPQEQPGPDSRARFRAMLDAYELGRERKGQAGAEAAHARSWWSGGIWFGSRVAGLAFAGVLLVAGYFAGTYTSGRKQPPPELAAMQAELENTRQMVVLSMLQQQSASERLQGVTYSTREMQADPRVLNALLHTLRYDTSVDVRLAALDALSRHSSRPEVRKGLLDAWQGQQSPLVQVALIDFLVESRDPAARQKLASIQQDANLNPAVRQRAEWALGKLN